MAITKLFFRKENKIADIVLDVVIEESASASARMTSNPVEKGADINDHIIVDPMTFTMSGLVTDAVSNAVDGIQGLTGTGVYTGKTSPSKDKWNDLLKLHAEREPFTLEQGLRSYENVVLLSLSESQNKDTSKALFFTATFQVLNLVGQSAVVSQQFNSSDVAAMAEPDVLGGLKRLL